MIKWKVISSCLTKWYIALFFFFLLKYNTNIVPPPLFFHELLCFNTYIVIYAQLTFKVKHRKCYRYTFFRFQSKGLSNFNMDYIIISLFYNKVMVVCNWSSAVCRNRKLTVDNSRCRFLFCNKVMVCRWSSAVCRKHVRVAVSKLHASSISRGLVLEAALFFCKARSKSADTLLK